MFDLDPGEGVPWNAVKEAAVDIRDLLANADLTSFVRTSGGKGLHVVVPITRRNTWDEVGEFAQQVAVGLAQNYPKRFVANMRKALRKGRIFIDYHRNKRGATSIASYSTRARPGAPVAAPLAWDELVDSEAANQWTILNLPDRLAALATDPWASFSDVRQSITRERTAAIEATVAAQSAQHR